MTQDIPQDIAPDTQAVAAPASDTLADLQADLAAYETIFGELARAMDPAAMHKVMTYLLRNARREASENQTYDTLGHRRLVARAEALMAQVAPDLRRQVMTERNEKNFLKKQKAKHQADSKRQLQGKR